MMSANFSHRPKVPSRTSNEAERSVGEGPKTKDMSLLKSLNLAFELGYIIALPAALLGFLGAFVDKRMETSPLFIILGFVLAFVISAYAVWKKVCAIIRQQYGENPKSSFLQ